jgi:hypothetical protein
MTAWLPFAVVTVLAWAARLALHRPVIGVPPWPVCALR